MAGLYIHIPFCESRCVYCGFYSTTSLKLRDAYVDALIKEMSLRPILQELEEGEKIETIYLGGGTPSQLTGEQLIRLFDGINKYISDINSDMEITMECNPDDVTDEFCQTLKQLPVNRISMGAQTFSNQRLRFLHRRHNAQEVKTAVERLRNIAINNISIDLMFGFPGENIEQWKSDIQEAISLNVEHISAYSLMYEEGTLLFRLLEQGKIEEIDEETSRNMYETLIQLLTKAGYEHYEISNFARPGYRSRHNSSYWHETPYIGIGAAAHSYKRIHKGGQLFVTRSWNINQLTQYIELIKLGVLPSEEEKLGINSRYNDLIATALRTSDGISIEHVAEEFGEELARKLASEAQKHINRGLMKIENDHLSLTPKGLYISDDIMSDLVIV